MEWNTDELPALASKKSTDFHQESISCKAGHSRERKAKPFVPTSGLYSTRFSRKIRQKIHGCSKVCFEARLKVAEFLSPFTPPPLHGGFRVSLLASTRGANVGRSFVLPLPSHRSPKLESVEGVLDFKYF
ncbi:hypothetical protein AVEN_253813-1 [Araneus ventricosus]|uniref:Uncharacterized protein n=1 Tax=Araneus ventricosus TaxID=182803 RepID=A0A4Y2WLI4_ARAVE|nr:hypothetical protein AVEN_253813-1 [Araneus ventricosus]